MRIWHNIVPNAQTELESSCSFARKKDMKIEIAYKDILSRCEQLSSFEARGKVDASGQSRYLDIHINKVDEQLVMQYINQAAALMAENLSRMIASTGIAGPSYLDFLGIKDATEEGMEMSPEASTSETPAVYFVRNLSVGIESTKTNTFADVSENIAYPKFNGDEIYTFQQGEQKLFSAPSGIYSYNESGDNLIETQRVEEGIEWDIRTDTRWNGCQSFTKHITEAIVAYAMAAWLQDKLPDRVAFYDNLFATTLALASKNIFTKQPPQK